MSIVGSQADDAHAVCVILLNFNSADDTIRCLASLLKLDMPGGLVVVDNASTDDSTGRLEEVRPSFEPTFRFLRNSSNRGFAAGNNVAICLAQEERAQYVWLLNNDTVVEPGALSSLVRTMEGDKRLGAVGSVLYEMHDADRMQAWGGGKLNRLTGHCRNCLSPDNGLTYLTGASMLIRAAALRDVMLDESFFFLWEDVDFSLRLKKAGWRIGVSERSIVYHKGGGSEPRLSAQRLEWHAFGLVRVLRTHGYLAWLTTLPIWGYYLMLAVRQLSPAILRHAARGWIKGWTTPLLRVDTCRDPSAT